VTDVLTVHEEPCRDGQLIDVHGEIDQSTTTLLADALRRATLERDGNVVVDLTGATFIDSSGISTLLNGLRRLTRLRRKLVVVCPPGPPRRTFELLGLVGTFHLVATRDEA
jgi:anti-sigma B factor antagonist